MIKRTSMDTKDDGDGERATDRCEHQGWTVSIDAHWQKAIICIPATAAEECLFASIASESIVVFSTGIADEGGSESADPIRFLPLPFKVNPEDCSACLKGGALVICVSRAASESEESAHLTPPRHPTAAQSGCSGHP